jgi:threonine aldolase
MKVIDLRSDTVTHPTPEMRRAMFEAEVGDDVYGEDPTVNRLEAMAAEKLGKEAALFTVSGTQGNLTAVLTHTRHGNEIVLGSEAHIFWYEVGGAAALGGVVMRTVPNDTQGWLNLKDIEQAIRGKNIHYPETALLCLENTQNRCGGAVLTPDYTKEACDLAHGHGLKVHLDGARIFNAAVALGMPASALTRDVDSVSFCISKGLSAPVGSLLCGTKEFIERARKFRKMLGGGMRQAGVLAAAGIVALETMVDRLAEDHTNARRLAAGLARISGITVVNRSPPTNIVMFDLAPEIAVNEFVTRLAAKGVKVGSRGGNLFRAVTHRMVSATDISEAVTHIETVCVELRKRG